MESFLSNLVSMVYCRSNKDNPVSEPKPARVSAEMREDIEGFVHIETAESDICTLTIPRNILTAEDRKVLCGGDFSRDLWECEQLDDKTDFRIHYPVLNAAVTDLYNRIEALHKHKTMRVDTCKSLESVEYRALRHLMGEDFESQDFDVELETNKKTLTEIVNLNNSPRMMAVSNRLDSLRREDIPLTSDEFKKFWDSLDAKPLGSDVYIEPLPDKSGVTVFSLDYNAMIRTKNLINFTSGKVKVTSRSKRNFHGIREEMNEAVDHQLLNHNATSTSDTQTTTDFTAKSGIKVSVYKADITRLAVDAIVNAANENLYHGGGVAAAIARAAGSRLEIEGDEHVKQYGPLKVTDIVPTCAGNLSCKTVFHAVGPRWSEYQDKTRCQKDLVQTVFNSLLEAHTLKFSSLAISSISSAVFGVPTDICASMYLQAVLTFDQQYGHNTSLQHIHFVDVNDYMVKKIQETFVQSFGSDSNKVPTMIATK